MWVQKRISCTSKSQPGGRADELPKQSDRLSRRAEKFLDSEKPCTHPDIL